MGRATMIAQMSLAGVLGDPTLSSVDMNGNFGLFGISETVDDLFVGFMIPVTSYEQLISVKSNYEAPDANKITKITIPAMGGQTSVMLLAQLGNYAIATKEQNYEKLAALIKAEPGSSGLVSSLEADETERAIGEPVWAYLNMKQVSKIFGPVIKLGMEEAKMQMPTEMGNVQGIMDEYTKLIDMLLNHLVGLCHVLQPDRSEPVFDISESKSGAL